MIDKDDTQTLDAFPAKPAKRKPGRPTTVSAEDRKKGVAARVRKHRRKKQKEAVVMAHIVDRLADPAYFYERSSWLELMAFVTGKRENVDGYRIEYLFADGKEGSKVTDLATISELISEGTRITKLT